MTSVPVIMCVSTPGDEGPTTPGGSPGGWGQGPPMMFRRGKEDVTIYCLISMKVGRCMYVRYASNRMQCTLQPNFEEAVYNVENVRLPKV